MFFKIDLNVGEWHYSKSLLLFEIGKPPQTVVTLALSNDPRVKFEDIFIVTFLWRPTRLVKSRSGPS